jgi:hypothetical protein
MVDPERYGPNDTPLLRGCNLPDDALHALYFETARTVLNLS